MCDEIGAVTAVWVLQGLLDDVEAVLLKQRFIFGGIEAGMEHIDAFAAVYGTPERASFMATGESEHRTWFGVIIEGSEHGALICLVQVEEAVPGENDIECLAKR